jgi:hypothetical protein
MWRALKAELVYFRVWLIGGLGMAVGISMLLYVLKWLFDDGEGVPGFIPNMFLLIAGMVVAFVAQGYRSEERRSLLLMAAPLTPRQVAGVLVLLPACLMGVGVFFTALEIGLEALLTKRFDLTNLHTTTLLGAQFWAAAQLGPLAQEATAARLQRRSRAGVIGWAVFAGAILLTSASWLFQGSFHGLLVSMITVGAAMGTTAKLYTDRTDFTR